MFPNWGPFDVFLMVGTVQVEGGSLQCKHTQLLSVTSLHSTLIVF